LPTSTRLANAAASETPEGPVPLKTTNAGQAVLITGAGGCIGSALAKAIVNSGPGLVVLLDHSEQNLYEVHMELNVGVSGAPHVPILGDILDDALLNEVLEKYRPDTIYHAAAFKHVPLMEANPIAVIRNNVLGTWALARAALRNDVARLLMISTDKAVNPRSVMGAAKRVAELVLLRFNSSRTRMSALRLGNVLGSHGSVLPLFRQQLERGGPLTVTHPESRRYFLSLPETVDLILAAAALGEDADILVPKLGEPVKIVDLAKQVIQEAGRNGAAQTEIVFTALRPGDKLSEELVSARERTEPSGDSRLWRVKSAPIAPDTLDSTLQTISEGVRLRNLATLLEALCAVVPEYQPSETLLSRLNPAPV
jgi:FlaA1/EpsC-like NDP-sugar epimerase